MYEEVVEPILTKDGLLPCRYITIEDHRGGYQLFFSKKKIQLFPVAFNSMTIRYIAQHQHLWDRAEIRVTYGQSICGMAPVFGVPFREAVKIALKRGRMRSKFYFPDRVENRRYENLLIQLDQVSDAKGDLLQLQAWQYTPGSRRAHYLHALSKDFETHVCHLDGAVIEYSESDLDIFLQKSRKVKGDLYQKFFRLDGTIEIEHMHGLAKTFFLTEDLYNEAFEVS